MITVIIADDQQIIREGIQYVIEQDPEIKVIGLAGSGKEAFELCNSQQPDLVLMDLVMPESDGAEGARLIKNRYNHIKIIILTTYNDIESISRALNDGADGYVLKDLKPDELIATIKSAVKGLNIMDHSTFSRIVHQLHSSPQISLRKKEELKVDLNQRELEIIRFIVAGESYEKIASSLFLSEGSVRNIISGIFKKLKVKDRVQLAVYAVKNDLI
ncbi:MAG TPA: response regulator transcription factor [Bacillota bacterium]|nr:response regulator transcription factor [Bacillota bacterium]